MKDLRADEGERSVFRRRVFYIPGYDPFHHRRYRELYRKEGTAQAALSGYDLCLRGKGRYGWRVTAETAGVLSEAEVEVLVWSDIVKASMSGGIVATYLQLAQTAWAYIGSGVLFRLMRLRKGPVIAGLYPIVMLLLQLAVALAIGFAVGWVIAGLVATSGLSDWLADTPVASPGLFQAVFVALVAGGLAIWAGVTVLILRFFKRQDGRLFAYYLMQDYAFSAAWGGANPPALEERMTQFRDTIVSALSEDWDEVLIVGHSSGAHLGVSIVADLIRAGLSDRRPALAFLSLGQVVPMVSFLPRADRLRADLHYLSVREEVTWIDVTAPGDGCAFALCDPVAVTGVSPPGKRWPLVVSAAFTQTLRPETWKALRWRFFRLHFQYLCAFDNLAGLPSDYDYFQITAGPVPLAARFAGRAPSKSRIDRPVSPYTSMAG